MLFWTVDRMVIVEASRVASRMYRNGTPADALNSTPGGSAAGADLCDLGLALADVALADAGHRRLMHDFRVGQLGFIHAAHFRDRRFLFVGQRLRDDAGVRVLLAQ